MQHHPSEATAESIDSVLASGLYIVIGIAQPNSPPYLVSMNYGYSRGVIYLHSGLTGAKVTAWTAAPQVSFTVVSDAHLVPADSACGWSMRFRSLVGTGCIEPVTETTERITALDALMRHYSSGASTYENRLLDRTAIWRLIIQHASVREKR